MEKTFVKVYDSGEIGYIDGYVTDVYVYAMVVIGTRIEKVGISQLHVIPKPKFLKTEEEKT